MRKAGGTAILAVIAGLSIALVAVRPATSDPGADETVADGSNEPAQNNPFVLADPGPGAVPFGELTADEQADVEAMAAESETDCGADVQTALARASAQEAARARNEIAARSVGLEGADQEGVIP